LRFAKAGKAIGREYGWDGMGWDGTGLDGMAWYGMKAWALKRQRTKGLGYGKDGGYRRLDGDGGK